MWESEWNGFTVCLYLMGFQFFPFRKYEIEAKRKLEEEERKKREDEERRIQVRLNWHIFCCIFYTLIHRYNRLCTCMRYGDLDLFWFPRGSSNHPITTVLYSPHNFLDDPTRHTAINYFTPEKSTLLLIY